ncbi:MAG TPA: plasma-membrane proton-efflux P-type ATPase [Dehalococcoidia bacterium]|nr:plasma-membrane proton-efflux P-type ATPase [Dehalococcoidia bacterium]
MKANLAVKNTSEYKAISTEETIGLLRTSSDGLTDSEFKRRLQIYGFNEVPEKLINPVVQFLSRYWGPMPWLLEVAIVLSIVLKHYLEAAIIFALLTINTVIGQIQSRGSQRALEALKKRLAVEARVLRDGEWVTTEAREIVPGDIISISLGDIVPADAKVLMGDLSIDQSVLTGESLPVDVKQSAIIYSGSIVRRGEARCVVVNTGPNTYFGKTAELVKIAKPKSHQEQIMLAMVRYMMFLGIGALVLVAAYAAATGMGILTILTFAVIFLMGAVPVALPAVLVIVQAVGATELARKGVLVTRLDSIEDTASIDILCLDKTGTITQNKLSVSDVIPFAAYTKEDVVMMASLASQGQGRDAIDTAVLDYAKASNINIGSYKQVSFTPFEPSTKRSEAMVTTDGKHFKTIKGAPQIVLSLCKGLDEVTRAKANQAVEELSLKGYRTLGVAGSIDDTDNLQFVGLLSLADPPRRDSRDMIERARELGVKPMMLTGDNIAIAREIARQAYIGDKIIRMEEFKKMDEAQQVKLIEESDGFAEIYPEDKYRIVKLLQSKGHMVGMTGDGVNDAPALKQAEMGIAVSSSTDVAKASASTVLTEPGVAVIIDAIKTSRHIYQRMLTWVINKVTKVIQIIGLLTVGFFWFHDAVVSLLGMALLIFANDFVTMSLATDNVKYTANPNKWNVRNITFASLIVGILLVGEGAIALFVGSHYFNLTFDQLRTFVMLALIFTSQFRVYIVRERRYFWSSRPGKELLIATLAAIVLFALLGVYGLIIPRVTLFQMLFILVFSGLFTFAIDYPKYLAFKKFGV